MLASILRLRTTIYKVPDLDAAKAWYAKAFQTEPYYDQAPYEGFNIAGYKLGSFSMLQRKPVPQTMFCPIGASGISVSRWRTFNPWTLPCTKPR